MIGPRLPNREQLWPLLDRLECNPGSIILIPIEKLEVCNVVRTESVPSAIILLWAPEFLQQVVGLPANIGGHVCLSSCCRGERYLRTARPSRGSRGGPARRDSRCSTQWHSLPRLPNRSCLLRHLKQPVVDFRAHFCERAGEQRTDLAGLDRWMGGGTGRGGFGGNFRGAHLGCGLGTTHQEHKKSASLHQAAESSVEIFRSEDHSPAHRPREVGCASIDLQDA